MKAIRGSAQTIKSFENKCFRIKECILRVDTEIRGTSRSQLMKLTISMLKAFVEWKSRKLIIINCDLLRPNDNLFAGLSAWDKEPKHSRTMNAVYLQFRNVELPKLSSHHFRNEQNANNARMHPPLETECHSEISVAPIRCRCRMSSEISWNVWSNVNCTPNLHTTNGIHSIQCVRTSYAVRTIAIDDSRVVDNKNSCLDWILGKWCEYLVGCD